MEHNEKLPVIFMVTEPFSKDMPHSSSEAWEAVALALAEYFQVFFLTPFFETHANEIYSTEVRIANNYTGLSLIIRRSKLDFINKIRLTKAFYAANQIFKETNDKAEYIVFLGLESLFFRLIEERNQVVEKLLIVDNMSVNISPSALKKMLLVPKHFFFLSEDIQNYYSNIIPKENAPIISQPIVEERFTATTIKRNSLLLVIDYWDARKLNMLAKMINRVARNDSGLQLMVSVSQNRTNLLKNKWSIAHTFIKNREEYLEAVSQAEKIIIASDYSPGFSVVAELMAAAKPILFLTKTISPSFPFKDYCEYYEETEWMENQDIVRNFWEKDNQIMPDLEEMISDNHAPEATAFAIKQKIHSIVTNNESDNG